jgi:arsenate reductase-like glutaredoxin family protein
MAVSSSPSIDRRWILALVLCALAPGCRKPAPARPPPEAEKLPPIEVNKDKKDGGWLYTYADPNGQFSTVDKPDAIPAGARRLVRVIDPSKGVADRRDVTTVYVIDANQLLQEGKVTARPLSREAFETGALAQLPPGESSLLADRPDGGEAAPAAPSAAGPPVVTVYGTSWCGACREARRYLSERKIPFADKDIERDPAAARELREKAARLGVPTDRVPILDVRGRLLIGFDRARVEALLGQPT